VVDLCATMPPGVKWRGIREKCVLRDAMRSVLPREIARRRKRPLQAPHDGWMRARLPDFAEELLSTDELARKGHFRPAAVRALLDEHRADAGHHGDLLYAILSVQLWDEMFLRGEGLDGLGFPRPPSVG
ncbi:MAG TPA: asparagine synthase-related protein, partial [Gemmatimonadota bacterium]|nr:asparagine synthase-related protein [Gemmatimonadota bacterium]